MNASINPFFERIAALRGARSLAYLVDMSRSLCSARLAPHLEILNFWECS
jgi:hypothetical protein